MTEETRKKLKAEYEDFKNTTIINICGQSYYISTPNKKPMTIDERINWLNRLHDQKMEELEKIHDYRPELAECFGLANENKLNDDTLMKVLNRPSNLNSDDYDKMDNIFKAFEEIEIKIQVLEEQKQISNSLTKKDNIYNGPDKIIYKMKDNDFIYLLMSLRKAGFISSDQNIGKICEHFQNEEGKSLKWAKQKESRIEYYINKTRNSDNINQIISEINSELEEYNKLNENNLQNDL